MPSGKSAENDTNHMNFKNAVQRSAVIIVILALSLLIGYAYHFLGHQMDLRSHPREYSKYVTKYSAQYGVPEYVVYAVIHQTSGFQSNKVSDDGRIGLMQLTPETFRSLTAITREELDTGILYDPETNIKYGTYYLSYLFTKHSRWKTVLSVYLYDTDTVETWCKDAGNTDENGNLIRIPDSDAREKVEKAEETVELYQSLYYS